MNDNQTERRLYPRKHVPLTVTARGVDSKGAKFECAALLHNISEGGMYMRIARCIKEQSKIQVHLSLSSPKNSSAGRQISASGRVLRVKPQPLDTCDVAVQFTRPLAKDAAGLTRKIFTTEEEQIDGESSRS